jgi:hypothetical protein
LLNDKDVQMFAKHAQQIAKRALSETAMSVGVGSATSSDFTNDIRVALNENYRALKKALRRGKLSFVSFEQYCDALRNTIRETLTDICN